MSGPEFLLIYLLVAIAANGWLRASIRAREGGRRVSVAFAQDPYRIAALREGPDEASRVAIVSLVDRGVLEQDGATVVRSKNWKSGVRRPLEQAIVDMAAEPSLAADIVRDGVVQRRAAEYLPELASLGLLPDERALAARRLRYNVAFWSLLLIAVARIANALLQGRHNIGFLIVLTIIALLFLRPPLKARLTVYGRNTLAHLETLFQPLRKRILKRGGESADAALLAAIFGLGALPWSFAFHNQLFPKPVNQGSGDSGGGGDSSGGDSGGDGGGGGCGGGCGGGGCGG